jgi:hypothetical protein
MKAKTQAKIFFSIALAVTLILISQAFSESFFAEAYLYGSAVFGCISLAAFYLVLQPESVLEKKAHRDTYHETDEHSDAWERRYYHLPSDHNIGG